MLNISGSIYTNSEIDSPVTKYPIAVTSCGHYRLIKKEQFDTYRPAGRKDYQLLYVAKGKARFTVHEQTYTVTEGHIVLYYPQECQKYGYSLADSPDIYWLHFSGNDVENILSQLSLAPQRILETGTKSIYIILFDHIIEELQLKRPHYADLCNTYYHELLTLMSRHTIEGNTDAYAYNEQVEAAIQLFHSHFNEPFCLMNYAKQSNMSPCWFTRIFHHQTGTSPINYLTEIRINKAKELLASSSYTIGEIAAMVGYPNPLYFSRIFKKRSGRSPTEYRKQ